MYFSTYRPLLQPASWKIQYGTFSTIAMGGPDDSRSNGAGYLPPVACSMRRRWRSSSACPPHHWRWSFRTSRCSRRTIWASCGGYRVSRKNPQPQKLEKSRDDCSPIDRGDEFQPGNPRPVVLQQSCPRFSGQSSGSTKNIRPLKPNSANGEPGPFELSQLRGRLRGRRTSDI